MILKPLTVTDWGLYGLGETLSNLEDNFGGNVEAQGIKIVFFDHSLHFNHTCLDRRVNLAS